MANQNEIYVIEHIKTRKLLANPPFDSGNKPVLVKKDRSLKGKYVEEKLKAQTQMYLLGPGFRLLLVQED